MADRLLHMVADKVASMVADMAADKKKFLGWDVVAHDGQQGGRHGSIALYYISLISGLEI